MLRRDLKDVRLFHRMSLRRLDEAEFLLRHRYTTAAVYLAGYAVECVLKALLLSFTPGGRQGHVLATFRGQAGHDLTALITRVRQAYHARPGRGPFGARGRPTDVLPPEVRRAFLSVSAWSTDLRYNPGTLKERVAVEFLRATAKVMAWAEGS